MTEPEDILEVEQPEELLEEDEVEDDDVLYESPEDLDGLPAEADIAPDESEMDHNLPANTGMPE